MEKYQIKQGVVVKHTSGKEETIVLPFRFKVNGEWTKSVLYFGTDRNTGKPAVFGRAEEDFCENFTAEGQGNLLEFLVANFTASELRAAARIKEGEE